jgi:beta-N-acetylglucosaminidase
MEFIMANNSQKSLSDVFKELEQVKNKNVEHYKAVKKEKEEKSFLFLVKHRTAKDNAVLILIVLIVLMIFSLYSSNYIFATDLDLENEEKVLVATFEKNENPSDVYEIISKNLSSTYQKEVFDKEEVIEYETKYLENKDLPKDETKVIQEGLQGSKTVTYVRSYENNEVTDENLIYEKINLEPQAEIIEVGTSELLKQYNIHIGDLLYVAEDTNLLEEANDTSNILGVVPKYYDVKTIEVINDAWLKVEYEEMQGYILCNFLTSETLTPSIKELCRKEKILSKVQINMLLNQKSGLTEDDYKTIFENQANDTNNVFKENYKAFFDAEEKYNINGIFLASIAVHESNWGRSALATNKHNLFGFGAYDESPYESAVTFESYEKGIDAVASFLASKYLNEAGTVLKTGDTALGTFYNGATVSRSKYKIRFRCSLGRKSI